MGLGGVKYNPDISEILKVIEEKRGVVTQIHKQLGISHTLFYELIAEYPQLKTALDKSRLELDNILCDSAENALLYALSQREDLGSSVRSAQYVLNNKGRKRGYTPPTVAQAPDSLKPDIDRVLSGFDKLHAGQPQEQSVDHSDSQPVAMPVEANPDISQ
jgi:hypothetical protein